jgi:predicted HicB family RNase H-like nuclease
MALARKKTGTNNPHLGDVVNEAQKEDLTPLHVQIPPSLHKRIKSYAVDSEKSLKEVVTEALERHLEQQGN